jgi:hypothetical protein
MNIVSANRGLNIHDMAMEQSNGQTTYDDSQKKAKLEVNMGFASSNSSGAAAEGAGETFMAAVAPRIGNNSNRISHTIHMHHSSSSRHMQVLPTTHQATLAR